MWFRNISGERHDIADLSISTWPGGEFEWPGWDRVEHGVVTGHAPIDGPEGAELPWPDPPDPEPPGGQGGSESGAGEQAATPAKRKKAAASGEETAP